MLKVGDKVVYIQEFGYKNIKKILTLYNIYTIKEFSSNDFIKSEEDTNKTLFYHFEETGKTGFNGKNFISLTEYRKLKIEKIKSKI